MIDLDQLLANWGYLTIALVVLLGNVGLPVPEETVLALAGYLVWAGELRLPAVLIVGVVSASAGDNIGYWFGRFYGQSAIERYARWVRVTPERLESAQRFVTRYGPLGVFTARFIAGFRFLGGPLAGAFGLRFLPFLVANLLGAAVFVPYAVGIGYAVGYGLGEYLERFRRIAGRVGYALLVGGAILTVLILAGRALRSLWTRRAA